LYLNSSGKVGIGTNAPLQKLSVAGSLKVTDTALFSSYMGIGTASPGALLDVNGSLLVNATSFQAYSGTMPKMEIHNTSITNTDVDGGTLTLYGTTTAAQDKGSALALGGAYDGTILATGARIRGAKENATPHDFSFYLGFDTRSNGGPLTEKMRIDNAGNVGIGTTTPGAKLEVDTVGGIVAPVIKIVDGNQGAGKVLTSNAVGLATWATPTAIREVADEPTPTAAQTDFTLSQTPSVNSKVKMYINGIRLSNTAYSNTGAALTYIPANNGGYALLITDRVQFDYYY
jgi:hypothetical protein